MALAYKVGWHNGKLTAKDIVITDTLEIRGNMTFGNAATDTLTVTGEATFSGVDKGLVFNATNTTATPAMTFLDDTFIADADGGLGAAAGFIVVKIGTTNYKLQTYAMS